MNTQYFLATAASVCTLFLITPASTLAATFFTESTTFIEDVVWTQAGSPYVVPSGVYLNIAETADFIVEAGVVVKMGGGSITTAGDMYMIGSATEPIIFTSLYDDTIAGDTNGDGDATKPSVARSDGSFSSRFRREPSSLPVAELKHVSFFYHNNIFLQLSEIVMEDVNVASTSYGMYLDGSEIGTFDISNFNSWAVDYTALGFNDAVVTLRDAYFTDSNRDSLFIYGSDLDIDGLSFKDIRQGAMKVRESTGSIRNVTMDSISLTRRENAFEVSNNSTVDIANVEISNVGTGAALAIYNGQATAENVSVSAGRGIGIETFSANTDFTNVTVTDFYDGFYFGGGTHTISAGDIQDNNTGIRSYATLTVTDSVIANNTDIGLFYSGVQDISAHQNWWGDSSGPYHATRNQAGAGDAVVGNVDFANWLTEPPHLEAEEVDPLLQQYLPILRMHPDEVYFPMNVEAFVDDSVVWDERGILSDEVLTERGSLEFLATSTDTSDWYIQFSGSGAKTFDLDQARTRYQTLVDGGQATATVYAYRTEDSYVDGEGVLHEYIVLQYWYFYAMNNWGEMGGFNDHEGDWESVFVFLDKATEEPQYVAFSAHHNDGDPSNPLQYDSVRRSWAANDVTVVDDRVHTFVSLGSHAKYGSLGNNGAHVVPAFVESNFDLVSDNGLNLSVLNIVNLNQFENSQNINWFNDYQGKWGVDKLLPGEDGPQGPLYTNVSGTKRLQEPIAWAGIDTIQKRIVESPTNSLSFDNSGVAMVFRDALEEGVQVGVEYFSEFINFGINAYEQSLLPTVWDFTTSMPNQSFTVTVTIPYEPEQLAALGIGEEFLTAYYFNEETDAWETVPSLVSLDNQTITFSTDHFSRYALGAPYIQQLESVEIAVRPGALSVSDNSRQYVAQIRDGEFTQTGMYRLVLAADSVVVPELLGRSGVTASGRQYIDMHAQDMVRRGNHHEYELWFRARDNDISVVGPPLLIIGEMYQLTN